MTSIIEERRQHHRYEVENSVSVTPLGVFQITDISKGGFCFKCPPYTSVSMKWVTDILTPITDLKKCLVEKAWATVRENGNSNLPSLINVGVKFGSLTRDQTNNLTKLIDSIPPS